jgi:pyridinium-3,5-bisthiocarboxylic acid mononucleotide nickel chelatase
MRISGFLRGPNRAAMRILYFDCFNGASGDMILGALVDAGLPLDALRSALGSLAIEHFEVTAERVLRAGVSATKFRLVGHGAPATVAHADQHSHHTREHHSHEHHSHEHHSHEHYPHEHLAHEPRSAPHDHAHRSLPEIYAHIDRSALTAEGKTRAKALFERLAIAEAAIHQMPVERVHLHEVGALDSIIDIVGAVFALDWFKPDRVVVSPLNVGRGMVHSAHGVFPVPAPATVSLLGDAPIFSRGPEAELLTPTGALLLTGCAAEFGPVPAMRISASGYGAGDRDFEETPNVLRVLIGNAAADTHGVTVVECEIDDMNPQLFGPLMDRLYQAGALEVFYVPVQMKKNRPGTLVTVLVAPAARNAIADVLFRETTTIGVRYAEWQRECLTREIVSLVTAYGTVRVKVARRGSAVMNAQPEFDDCAARASEHGVATKDVQAAALKAWLDRPPS